MKRLLQDWDRFFFQPQTARVLGVYRIAIGVLTIYSFLLFAKDTTAFFSDQGVLRLETVDRVYTREWHTLLAFIRSPLGVKCMMALLFAAGVLFAIGFHTRIASIALFVLVTSFHERNNLVLNSGDTVLRTMLFLFMFAPAGAALSVDSLRRRLRSPDPDRCGPELVAPWAQRMMQLQVALIYFTTVYAKSRGDLYHNGSAMYYVFGIVDFSVHGIENLMNYPVLYSALTFATLFAEIAISFLIWFRATRPYAVALGILLHLWIMWCMVLPVFGILMIATYLCFFTEEEYEGAREWLRARFGQSRAWRFTEQLPARLLGTTWFRILAGRRLSSSPSTARVP
jgi:hypothetical protein